jgi:hypothetical protein
VEKCKGKNRKTTEGNYRRRTRAAAATSGLHISPSDGRSYGRFAAGSTSIARDIHGMQNFLNFLPDHTSRSRTRFSLSNPPHLQRIGRSMCAEDVLNTIPSVIHEIDHMAAVNPFIV